MGRRDTAEKHDQILCELNEERAAALLRISRTLDSLIVQLRASRERIQHAHGADRPREIAAYRELRQEALRYRWYLEVQREALGLRYHHRLDEFYPIPAPLTP
jgi:hypothetical protein